MESPCAGAPPNTTACNGMCIADNLSCCVSRFGAVTICPAGEVCVEDESVDGDYACCEPLARALPVLGGRVDVLDPCILPNPSNQCHLKGTRLHANCMSCVQ